MANPWQVNGDRARRIEFADGTVWDEARIRMEMGSSTMVDTLVGTQDADVLMGSARADLIEGLGGADMLSGAGGHDSLYGGAGRDTLIAGQGASAANTDGGQTYWMVAMTMTY